MAFYIPEQNEIIFAWTKAPKPADAALKPTSCTLRNGTSSTTTIFVLRRRGVCLIVHANADCGVRSECGGGSIPCRHRVASWRPRCRGFPTFPRWGNDTRPPSVESLRPRPLALGAAVTVRKMICLSVCPLAWQLGACLMTISRTPMRPPPPHYTWISGAERRRRGRG